MKKTGSEEEKTEQRSEKKQMTIRVILITVGSIFFIWFLLPVFTHVKPDIGNLTGMGVFALVLLYGIFFEQVNQFLRKRWESRAGKIVLLLLAAVAGIILTLAAVTYGCILHAAAGKAEAGAEVIVLGCKVNGDRPSLSLLYRMEAALSYLEENPDSLCIVTGAKGKDEVVTEASVMYRWFAEKGIAEEHLIAEEEAEDTQENMEFSKRILEERGEGEEKVVVVTNDFHMYRALRYAKAEGLNACGLSAKTPWWLYPTYVVREMYGILENWFLY